MKNDNHIWKFSRIGGINRVNLESGADLIHLENLDQKLWTALSCPVKGLEIDPEVLSHMDTDKDGKIRVPEVLAAVKWILSLIKNPNDLLERRTSLPLSAINTDTEEGKNMLASAKQILINLGKTDAKGISRNETSDVAKIFADTQFNGDGIITEQSTSDENLQNLIKDIIATVGSKIDRCGLVGISEEELELFTKQCEDYSNWFLKAEEEAARIRPFGDATNDAYDLYLKIQPKIDDYFLRCKLSEFDPSSSELLNSLTSRIETINNKNISNSNEEMLSFPISKIEANRPLSFSSPINPAWENSITSFKNIIQKSLGKDDEMTETEWHEIKDTFKNYENWLAEKEGVLVEPLGLEKVREYLKSNQKEQILDLIAQDIALETESNNIILVDKLVGYYCYVFTLLNNFVSFSDFYSPNYKGIFQAGTLYFDQRSCDLCIIVSDMGKHNTMAKNSGICLVYFECTSKVKNEKMTIVAAFTDGDVDNLEIGRNALFYDNNGQDWDATIIKILENPISIRQAFWSPYRKMSKLISKQIEKFASSQDDKVNKFTTEGIEKAGDKSISAVDNINKPADPATPVVATEAAKPAPFDIAKFAGIFAAIGLAFGAIGAVLASIVGGFLALTWWKMPLAILGIILAISGPSMILAWLKLRKRDLAPVLDANGWAINARATVNIAFGRTLTSLAKIPKNAKLNLKDPFKKKRKPIIPIVITIIIIAAAAYALWHWGYIAKWGIL
ncbi:MAG: hypothetical protein PHR79_11180 [Bacteroidales bacterium]|nr:hypothetical protein [Bacteroidales bacterium]